jgi:hypothetical protein
MFLGFKNKDALKASDRGAIPAGKRAIPEIPEPRTIQGEVRPRRRQGRAGPGYAESGWASPWNTRRRADCSSRPQAPSPRSSRPSASARTSIPIRAIRCAPTGRRPIFRPGSPASSPTSPGWTIPPACARSHHINAHMPDDLDAAQSARIAAARRNADAVSTKRPAAGPGRYPSASSAAPITATIPPGWRPPPAIYPQTLPWELCSYTPQQLRQAYGADRVAQTGKGVRVAIVDDYASPTIEDDANRYSQNHGLPQLTYLNFAQLVPPGLYNVKASDRLRSAGLVRGRDAGCRGGAFDGAGRLYPLWRESPAPIPATRPSMASSTTISPTSSPIPTASTARRCPSDFIESENQFFMQAAAEGMTIVFSSGDDGDVAAANGIASGSWEATSPYVTGVGGTSLALRNANGREGRMGLGQLSRVPRQRQGRRQWRIDRDERSRTAICLLWWRGRRPQPVAAGARLSGKGSPTAFRDSRRSGTGPGCRSKHRTA